ncbi:ABC transporter permease [Lacihabitans soyangensis]|uniref:ABC transporter permease n=1 Tax=Lacihabitans soyangensis TaxID=869394 RepID=A0AAE3KVA6_9BACT|nr:ABC transporter permease [Lacihabitans soyangensis]MCP9765908.1 ABC transporter permease [Lacihabitans soyangensis]
MLKNYFKIAWRSIQKSKMMFAINVTGLALGIATCLVISLFVLDEISYDRFNEKANQIVRVNLSAKMGDELIDESSVMAPVAQTFKNEFPEVLTTTRLLKTADIAKVVYNNQTFRSGKSAMIDSTFFDVFTIKFVKGNAKNALNRPNTVVLTQKQAKAYFGNEDPINKILEIKDQGVYAQSGYVDLSGLYTVTGIIEEIPANAHFHFDILTSMAGNPDGLSPSWLNGNYHTYLLLSKQANLAQLETKMKLIPEKYMSSQIKSGMGMTFKEFLDKGNKVGFKLLSLTDIHLYSDYKFELEQSGDIKTVYIFSAIALFMLFIACINFMNLSTASASKRVKEIGMRKVLGSEKSQLIFQFLTEAFLATLVAMLLASLIFFFAIPFFNQISGKAYAIQDLLNAQILAVLVLLTLIISIFAGAYPAFFMSGFKPLQALKNRFSTGNTKGIRSGLVVFQFAISATLIIGTLVVGKQMQFIKNKDIGYDRKHLIVIRQAGLLGKNFEAFRAELKKDSRVKSISTSAFLPAGPSDNFATVVSPLNDPMQRIRAKNFNIDEEYIPTLSMKMLAGRNFSKEAGTEKNNIIINESAIKAFGLKPNPIGQTVMESVGTDKPIEILTIVGLVKDFHARSLHEKIDPLIMRYNPYYGLIIKVNSESSADLINSMKSKWTSYGTGEPFSYAFLDELYNETYQKEANMNSILRIFAILTIFVACLGLFGLVTFTTEQRFKEIGIRKVLGSSVPQIVGLLSKDFLKLIVVSFLIAFPLGYYIMQNWLQDFEYRTELNWWIFLVAGIATVVLAFITISYRSIQAALMNPVKSLKSE